VLPSTNPHIVAYLREYGAERVLVVHNVSGSVQPVELDLARFQGTTPTDMIGNATFPAITQSSYFLSIGPYDSYWVRLASNNEL
jgi:maltose alpha-D-glucosyltransferase / alpha-amylase